MAADDDATDKVLSDPGATVHRRELSSTGGRGGGWALHWGLWRARGLEGEGIQGGAEGARKPSYL